MHASIFYHLGIESVLEGVDRGGLRRGRAPHGLERGGHRVRGVRHRRGLDLPQPHLAGRRVVAAARAQKVGSNPDVVECLAQACKTLVDQILPE
jgi:hypothetical protein